MNELQTKDEQELENKMYLEIKDLIESSKRKAYVTVNTILLDLYCHIGENIVNNLQKGKKRAKYGEHVLENLSVKLVKYYGKGFSLRNLRNMRNFYVMFPIRQALVAELSWMHYLKLLSVKNNSIRNFYMQNA